MSAVWATIALILTAILSFATHTSAHTNSRSLAQESACLLEVDQVAVEYDNCLLFDSFDIKVYWSTLPASSESLNTISINIAYEGATPGWVGFGIPKTPNVMVGGSAVISRLSPESLTGAAADGYFLEAQSSSQVQPPSEILFDNVVAEALPDGSGVKASFSVDLPVETVNTGATPILLAVGPLTSDGELSYHTQRGGTTIDFLSTSGGGGSAPSIDTTVAWGSKGRAHAWLMTLGFGILMPVAVLGAIGLRAGLGERPGKRNWWFEAHRIIMAVAYCMVIAGLGLGISDAGGWVTIYPVKVHGALGMTAFVLATVQVFMGILRPAKTSKIRPYFNVIHHFFGRAAIIIAIANIYYGMIKVKNLDAWTYATYSAILGILVLCILGMHAYRLKRTCVDKKSKESSIEENGGVSTKGVAS